jgi:hypothetical protein
LDDQQTYSYIINGVTLKFKGFSQEESACRCCDDLVTSVGNGPALWLTLSEGMSCFIGQSARKEQVADQMRCFFSYRDSLLICVYTKDSDDLADLQRVVNQLRESLDRKHRLVYKEDKMTLAGGYKDTTARPVSKWYVNPYETEIRMVKGYVPPQTG